MEPFQECLVGRADLREVLPPFLERWGWPHSLDDYIERWFEEEREVDERLVTVVGLVRRAGVPVYMATNQERHRLEFMRTTMGFDGIFDEVFCSALLGTKKPEREFFTSITAALGVPAEGILFWDDSSAHVAGARLAGWQAEVYSDFDAFVNKTSAMLGLPGLRGGGEFVARSDSFHRDYQRTGISVVPCVVERQETDLVITGW